MVESRIWNSALYGIKHHNKITDEKANNGAIENKNFSPDKSSIFSLHKSFIASATVCKIPQIPTLLGPFLCVNQPNSFLSAKTKTKTTKTKKAIITQNGIIENKTKLTGIEIPN